MQNFDYISELMQHEKCLLVTRSSRLVRNFMAHQIENSEDKITYMEWLVLGVTCRGPADGLTMSEVAGMIDVTLPQITAITNKLVEYKLVKQKIKAKDRRTRLIIATSKGKKRIKEVETKLTLAIRDWVYPNTELTFDDLNKYFYVLDQLTTIDVHGVKSPSYVTQLKKLP